MPIAITVLAAAVFLTFNLRDRVARSFSVICLLVMVYTAEAWQAGGTPDRLAFW